MVHDSMLSVQPYFISSFILKSRDRLRRHVSLIVSSFHMSAFVVSQVFDMEDSEDEEQVIKRFAASLKESSHRFVLFQLRSSPGPKDIRQSDREVTPYPAPRLYFLDGKRQTPAPQS